MSDDKVEILVDEKPVEVTLAPQLTVICHQGEVGVEIPSVMEINPEMTVARANAISAEDWKFLREVPEFLTLWAKVWGEVAPPEVLAKSNLALKHVAGLILCIVEARAAHKRFFIRLPETYLHPKQQYGLADLFVTLSGGKK